MKKNLLLLLLIPLFLGGCAKKVDEGPAKRTVLVYVAAANNLYSYAQSNLTDMIAGYGQTDPQENRLIVYYDTGDGVPCLLQVDASGAHPLQEYPGANSTDPDQLHKVVSQVLQDFPAKSYGLILWSHATGWIPKGFPLAVKNQWSLTAFPATRTFGNQYFEGQRCEIEISDLADALPTGAFDFILIDACLMGGVEVAYALREKTDYLIAYPTEVIADGMPYREITAPLFSDAPTQDYCRQIARKFYEHYDAQSGVYRSASVALIETAALEALARSVREVVKDNPEVATLPLSSVQHYDLYSSPFMYDLDDFIGQLATPAQYQTFRQALDNAVLYQAHTDTFFSLPLERCCGLSVYIPSEQYADCLPYYQDTPWYRACYL